MDIDAYHRSTTHAHHHLLLRSAEEQGVRRKKGSKLLPCVGCSVAKGISAQVNKVTESRSDKKLGRVFVDLSGKKAVKSKGDNQYAMIFGMMRLGCRGNTFCAVRLSLRMSLSNG